jgi:hypothetical protein
VQCQHVLSFQPNETSPSALATVPEAGAESTKSAHYKTKNKTNINDGRYIVVKKFQDECWLTLATIKLFPKFLILSRGIKPVPPKKSSWPVSALYPSEESPDRPAPPAWSGGATELPLVPMTRSIRTSRTRPCQQYPLSRSTAR